MGYYLNPGDIVEIYGGEASKPYFVDKTGMLDELIPLVEQRGSFLAVTAPRRFGKSVMAAMIGAYFGKGADASELFDSLKIAQNKKYAEHLNKHNLIYIDFSKDVGKCKTYDEYIETIEERIFTDLKEAYPDVNLDNEISVGAALRVVSLANKNEKFILLFDEWDYIFHRKYFTEQDRGRFTAFLGDMTKGRSYVELAYLTGILPIRKYSSSDTLNNFDEYNMAASDIFGEYLGFTESEVDELYERYLKNCANPAFTREELAQWYDGYHMAGGKSIYNPNSVVKALTRNRINDYWLKFGEYGELSDYVLNDVDGVREDVMMLVAGEAVEANISEYASTAPELTKKNQILSAMVVYGYLNNCDSHVRIPNKELAMEFDNIIQEEPKYSYLRELGKVSKRILQATYDGNEDMVGEMLAIVHTTESPLKAYNDEAELSGSVKLAYIAARDRYDMEREDQAGMGYVDYIFYPHNRADDGIIIELKVDDTPENALKQIKKRDYALKFKGKVGEKPRTTGRIILVGIGYYREDKTHKCKIEIHDA